MTEQTKTTSENSSFHKIWLTVFSLCVAYSLEASQIISVNFKGSSNISISDEAGFVPAINWNNLPGGAASSPLDLIDNSGSDSGTDISFSSNSEDGFHLGNSGSSEDAKLYVGQIIEESGGDVEINFLGIPYQKYALYVYYGHGSAHAGNSVRIAASTNSFIGRNEDLKTYSDPIEFRLVDSTTSPGDQGNYCVFPNLSRSNLTVTLSYVTGSSGCSGIQIVKTFLDTDLDGLDDGWEMEHFEDLDEDDSGDPDTDGLSNLAEQSAGTEPDNDDSDGDGLIDGVETKTGSWTSSSDTGTDPLNSDSDGDNLKDGVETNTGTFSDASDTGTDPNNDDSDGDHATDGIEVQRGLDPTNAGVKPDWPNIIYILADDLGWGEVGCYGQEKILTPSIDRLATQGVKFTQHYAGAPVCAPTRCILMTGMDSGHAYVRNNYETGGYQLALSASETTIADMLQEVGYSTCCIGKWGLGGPGTSGDPNNKGFDHFFGYLGQVQAHHYYPAYLWRNGQKAYYNPADAANDGTTVDVPGADNNGLTEDNDGNVHSHDAMTAEALQWIGDHKDEPFFLYLAYPIPHVSVQPPAHIDDLADGDGIVFSNDVRTAVEEFYPGQPFGPPIYHEGTGHYSATPDKRHEYAAMISAMDRDIGRIMDLLDTYNIASNTVVAFSSDNGATYLGEVDYAYFNSSGGLRGMKGSVYEGGIREPLVVRWPGKIATNSVSDHISAQWDTMPTIADILEIQYPSDSNGKSFLPTLLGHPENQEDHDFLYWEFKYGSSWMKAVRMGDWKGVRIGNPTEGAAIKLFDLANDVDESSDVASAHPDIVEQIDRIMGAHHTLSHYFFRDEDEFPIWSQVSFSLESPGVELTPTASSGGYALTPLEKTVTGQIRFTVEMKMKSDTGNINGIFMLGPDNNINNMLKCELRGDQSKYVITHQSQSVEVPFQPDEDSSRLFELEVAYDTVTGIVEFTDGVKTLEMTLNSPISELNYTGIAVDNAVTVFGPVGVHLPIPPLTDPLASTFIGERFSVLYNRSTTDIGNYIYEESADLAAWAEATPFLEQPRHSFGNRQEVEARFNNAGISKAFYRLKYVE